MHIIEIEDMDMPDLAPFVSLTEAQLRNRLDPSASLFIAESPKVIKVALQQGYNPVAILCERRHIEGDAAEVIAMAGDIPVYTGSREMLAGLTGYTLTRGVLCALRRPEAKKIEKILEGASRVAVIDSVTDTTNIGAIFRSAAALGMDAVLLTPTSCDPFNRRSVRVSMGSVFLVPWTWIEPPLSRLHEFGFKTVAMALTDDSVSIEDTVLMNESKLAIVLGTEGDGLSAEAIADCDYTAKIPMSHGVDSLNVAAASAVSFWQLRKK